MTTPSSKTDYSKAATKTDPVGKSVEPMKVRTIEDEGIGPDDPYPTGNPQVAQTYAEINGLVPTGTGPLAPAAPLATKGG